jgi:FG-GAP repeat/FG-GAP-like repeat
VRPTLTAAAAMFAAAVTTTALTIPALAAPPTLASGRHPTLRDDFNGDGFGDLAVGMPAAPVDGKRAAGYILVTYGSPKGLDPQRRKVLHQSDAQIPGTAESGDRFGSALTGADLNHDGYADLVTSTPMENLGTFGQPGFRNGAGSVTVIWGGPTGLRGGTVVNGLGDYDGLGSSLTIADFDGDHEPDIAAAGMGDENGSVWLLHGPFGPGSRPAAPQLLAKTPFGGTRVSVASGDTDGDGTPELVTTVVAEASAATTVHRWDGTTLAPATTLAGGGDSLAVADFDHDGRDDIAVGMWRKAAAPTPHDGGSVTVVHGAPAGPGTGRASTTIDQDTPGVSGTGLPQAEWSDDFGRSLSAADIDHDHYADLAVGVPGENDHHGRAVLLRGTANGLTGAGAQSISQETPGVPGVGERQDRFAETLHFLDANGDTHPDLAVAAPGEDSEAGRLWTVPGTPGGLCASRATTYNAATFGLPAPTAGINLGYALPR